MTVRDKLVAKRLAINEWREGIEGTVMTVGMIVFPILTAFISMALFMTLEPWLGPVENWLEFKGNIIGGILAVLFIILMAASVLVLPYWLGMKWIGGWWERHRRLARRALDETQLALLVAGDTGYGQVADVITRHPWLGVTASEAPQSLDQRIEFASDYWKAYFAIAKGGSPKLRGLVRHGNAVRLVDDASGWLFNGCFMLLLLAFLLPLFPVIVIAMVLSFGIAIQQQAVQAELLDYFIENTDDG